MDNKKKSDAKDALDAGNYFLTLMKEDTTINLNEGRGGPVVHPLMLASTPTLQEIESHVKIPRQNDDVTFSWTFPFDVSGGNNPKPITVRATFNTQLNLETLSGLKGTVTTSSHEYTPQ